MPLLNLLILLAAVGLVLLFVTEILIPAFLGTPFFPTFRKKTEIKKQVSQAEADLAETTEYVFVKERLDDINRRKAELEKKE